MLDTGCWMESDTISYPISSIALNRYGMRDAGYGMEMGNHQVSRIGRLLRNISRFGILDGDGSCVLCGECRIRPAINHRAQQRKDAEAPFFSPNGASISEPGPSGPGVIEPSPSCAQLPTDTIRYPASNIQYPASSIQHPASSIPNGDPRDVLKYPGVACTTLV